MPLKQREGDSSTEPKKRRRVGFNIDPGVEASECIKVFLVKDKDEVGSKNIRCIDPVDINQYFGEDGKIYGYKKLKVNIWLSTVSFHAYPEITYESSCDYFLASHGKDHRLDAHSLAIDDASYELWHHSNMGGKGITDLNSVLMDIFGESLIEKEQFLKTFSTEQDYISNIVSGGSIIPHNLSAENEFASNSGDNVDGSTIEVIQTKMHSMPVGLLYSRLVPLVLLLLDGGKPIDITDPKWEMHLVVKKLQDAGDCITTLLGFATVFHFFHYPDSTRLRIGQILVIPPYQGQGHGRRLLESVYSVAVSENVYDVTIEQPSDYLQHLRACIDTRRLLNFEPIKPAISSVISRLNEENLAEQICKSSSGPPLSAVEIARQKLKINKKQFLKCWEVLIYLNLDHDKSKCLKKFNTWISDRVKGDLLDKDDVSSRKKIIEVPNDYDHEKTFILCWSTNGGETDCVDGNQRGDQPTEEQINQLIKERIEDIVKIANKVLLFEKQK